MKRLLKCGLIGLMALGLFGCDIWDDDGYSLGDFWVGFGILHMESETGFTVEMDNGAVLIPLNGYRVCKMEDLDRVLINYTILGNREFTDDVKAYYVRVNSMSEILYKGILDITPEVEDSIGKDPIRVRDLWKTRNMLTFELEYYGNMKMHYINLVKQPGELSGKDQPVELELRHNENDDRRYYRMIALVTFDLSSIQIPGQDTVSYVVRGTTYKGDDFSFQGVYRY
ncbi:MAG: NigD-like C-terminal domain-containing protein [Mangrovibacterium sp.]